MTWILVKGGGGGVEEAKDDFSGFSVSCILALEPTIPLNSLIKGAKLSLQRIFPVCF